MNSRHLFINGHKRRRGQQLLQLGDRSREVLLGHVHSMRIVGGRRGARGTERWRGERCRGVESAVQWDERLGGNNDESTLKQRRRRRASEERTRAADCRSARNKGSSEGGRSQQPSQHAACAHTEKRRSGGDLLDYALAPRPCAPLCCGRLRVASARRAAESRRKHARKPAGRRGGGSGRGGGRRTNSITTGDEERIALERTGPRPSRGKSQRSGTAPGDRGTRAPDVTSVRTARSEQGSGVALL